MNGKKMLAKLRGALGTLPIPAWAFSLVTVVYCETLLHLWVTQEFSWVRFAAVVAFAIGFGGVLAQIFSFIGHKTWGKWASVGIMTLVTVFYLVEYFVSDAYVNFMPMGTLLSGAKGVATDFADVVLGQVTRGFWRILVMLLPVMGYALLAKPVVTSWRLRWFGLVLAIAGYLGGFGIVQSVGTDVARFSSAYNFDSAIRCFGLHMGMTLDAFHSGSEEEVTFVTVPQTPRPHPGDPAD